ncbi:MAG: carboxymuconolactone decarboxylase family protein [Acidimicrobiales bacterium]
MSTDGSSRKRHFRSWPDGYAALARLDEALRSSGLEANLLELVKIRASQINGCAYCIDLHAKDARAAGETEQRIYALSAWRETPFFSGRERAALAFTEAVTLVPGAHDALDAVVEEAAAHFDPQELIRLLYLVIEINAFNRLSIATGAPEPGSYVPRPRAHEET